MLWLLSKCPERILGELECEWVDFEYLPPYCPELNPVEHVWSTTKWGRLCSSCPRDVFALKQEVSADLRS